MKLSFSLSPRTAPSKRQCSIRSKRITAEGFLLFFSHYGRIRINTERYCLEVFGAEVHGIG